MVKRVIDLAVSSMGLVVLSPVLAFVALLVRWKLGAPVLFRQLRPGLRGVPFELMKFRTMTNERSVDGNLLPNDERLTVFGRRLRSMSLDELPELVNVIRGDMSLVGPRPLRMEYLPRYSEHQARRHEVRPGITGLAQVRGRNSLTWEEKFDLDVWYVDNRTLWLDLRLLAETVVVALRREGVHDQDGSIVKPFLGSATEDGAKNTGGST